MTNRLRIRPAAVRELLERLPHELVEHGQVRIGQMREARLYSSGECEELGDKTGPKRFWHPLQKLLLSCWRRATLDL